MAKLSSTIEIADTGINLGTVAAGIIIESGSNSNGSWTKWANGTMICEKTVTVSTTINAQWGNWYESPNGVYFGNFAQSFIEKPRVVIQACIRAAWIESLNGTTKDNIGWGWITKPTCINTVEEYTFDIIAIGKWK